MKGQLRISGGRKLLSPIGLGTRPTTARVREAVMNLLGSKLISCQWLDLFSGSGAMACEALQKGAKRVVAVERDKRIAKICKSNLIKTASGLSQNNQVEVISQEVLSWLRKGYQPRIFEECSQKQDQQFDLVYLDPPYEANLYESVLENLAKGNWLKKNCTVICEYSSQNKLAPPFPWVLQDQRVYGKTALLLINLPGSYYDGTGSMHQQTNQAK